MVGFPFKIMCPHGEGRKSRVLDGMLFAQQTIIYANRIFPI